LLDSVTAPAAHTGQILLRGLMARVEVAHRDRPERAFELTPSTDEVDDSCTCVRAEVALWRGWGHARRSETVDEATRALHLLKESQELFASICDPLGRAWALLGRAQAYATLEEYGLMRRVLDDASALLNRLQDTQAERWLHELSIPALRIADRYEQAERHVVALRSVAEEWDDRRVRGHATAHAALLQYASEAAPSDIIDTAETAASLLRQRDGSTATSLLRAVRAHVGALSRQAAWGDAFGLLDDAAASLPNNSSVEKSLQTLRAQVALRRGNAEHALSMLDDVFERRLSLTPNLQRSRIALLYGKTFAAQGRPDEAETWLRRAHRTARETGHRANEQRAREGLTDLFTDWAETTRTTVHPADAVEGFVAESREMQAVADTVRQIQPSHSPVLITGEGGAGKRLVARTIHATSVRSDGPVKQVSCDPTQAGESLEAQLFGTTGDGMFQSGAVRAAHGGTLIIEDIDALPSSLQSSLLRLLDTGAVAGGHDADAEPVDVRIIATTTADLDARVQEGRFRQALRNRLRVISLHVPPLRERRPDISLLARHFLDQLRPADSALVSITQPAMEALLRYNWPGNVRQLHNEIERALVHVQSEPAPTIDLDILNDIIVEGAKQTRSAQTREEALDAILEPDQTLSDVLSRTEKAVIERVLRACDGQVTASADVLGLTRQGLYKKMKRLDIDASTFQSASEPTPTT
jgi:DNA-binding NtrC family response regulator/tetratricopeptide (TPR) repeat protein